MLHNTFCHIPSIGLETERELWDAGVHCWDNWSVLDSARITRQRMRLIKKHIPESLARYYEGNLRYFTDALPAAEHWRLFKECRSSTAYIDIETTGMNGYQGDHITTIALYNGETIAYYVHGKNLDDFVADIRRYKLIVTFNGKCFDLPFIQKYFNITVPAAHIDLRYVLRSLGYRGGLKSCEHQLGISRNALEGVDGFFAVLLWQEYKRSKDPRALETLLAYNIEDVVNLETLMVTAYNRKIMETPFAESHLIAAPVSPPLPFTPDGELIERIRWRVARW